MGRRSLISYKIIDEFGKDWHINVSLLFVLMDTFYVHSSYINNQ